MRVNDLAKFIAARERHRMGGHTPGAKVARPDPIIGKFRFCNMDRNDDRVTKWIFAWARQFGTHEDLWFVFVVARLLNQPDSLEAVEKYLLPFKPAAFGKTLQARKAAGLRNFNAAYIVSTNGRAMDKLEYISIHILQPLWRVRKAMRPNPGETLSSYHARLMGFQGLGSFMAAQVVADLKYAPGPLAKATDFGTFAASGPGSRRGLNRVLGNPTDAPWKELAWRGALTALRSAILPKLAGTHLEGLTAQNLQNCLCEFDKYERARLGDGVPKQLYAPYREGKEL